MKLRKTTRADIGAIMTVLNQAREAQRKSGFRQWDDGYPSEALIEAEISEGNAYLLDDDGATAGYIAIMTGDDEYDRMAETWTTRTPYAVFHRMALGDSHRGRGASHRLIELAEAEASRLGALSVRIDTGQQNMAMQRLMQSHSYKCRGLRHFVWGPRLVYEKDLDL